MCAKFYAITVPLSIKAFALVLFLVLAEKKAVAQADTCCVSQDADSICLSPNIARQRKKIAVYSATAAYVGAVTALNFAWYDNFPRSNFHFFNDNREWLQMDKFGHFTAAGKIVYNGYYALTWTGINKKRSIWYAAGTSMLCLTTFEVFDGFSSEWGFSWGDMGANLAGTAFTTLQLLKWRELKFNLKFSFHKTKYPQYRPELLGRNHAEQWLMDYNGQTHWVSFSPWAWSKNPKAPRWLCLAIGYGAEGMTGGFANPASQNGQPIPHFTRYRQYYLSLDIDLSKVRTRYKFLSTVFLLLSNVKIPFPAVEFNSVKGIQLHPFYF